MTNVTTVDDHDLRRDLGWTRADVNLSPTDTGTSQNLTGSLSLGQDSEAESDSEPAGLSQPSRQSAAGLLPVGGPRPKPSALWLVPASIRWQAAELQWSSAWWGPTPGPNERTQKHQPWSVPPF